MGSSLQGQVVIVGNQSLNTNVINTPNVNVANTPSVNVANTPSVNIANSATNPVPAEITNTPNVNIANTPSVNVANTPSVNIANPSTNPVPTEITNTPNVNIANTPSVNIASIPSINVNQLTPSAVATGAGVSAAANTNILSSSYAPPAVGKIRVTFAGSASGVLSLVIVSGTTSYVYALNAGNTLNANAIYTFEIPVSPSYTYNIQYSVAATVFYQIDFISN